MRHRKQILFRKFFYCFCYFRVLIHIFFHSGNISLMYKQVKCHNKDCKVLLHPSCALLAGHKTVKRVRRNSTDEGNHDALIPISFR